jgi:hypothetical protein
VSEAKDVGPRVGNDGFDNVPVRIADTFRWVAGRFGPGGENVHGVRTLHRSADLAVTGGPERGAAQVDVMVSRVAHVLRREATDLEGAGTR